ncbi:hypothetical protein [Mycobacteroides chelonae]|jgi:hypothetical protein|uniref:hypothetical protein n=1 Tax=Mycobacteroides chelonae TaxID=1774 RepID=UPI0008A99A7D|nr:hypothetical protein [Mycobacteroides chelonae]OHU38196.1 hypothetical protein BKG78_12990 [Mycobacteroides chelonae]
MVIAAAAVAFVALAVALVVGAFWAGWRLRKFFEILQRPVTPPPAYLVGRKGPLGTVPQRPYVIYRDEADQA